MLKYMGLTTNKEYNEVADAANKINNKYKILQKLYLKQKSQLDDFKFEMEAVKRMAERYRGWWQEELIKNKESNFPTKDVEDGAEMDQYFNKEELIFLIKTCHPDKHSNSDVANNVTSVLLEMKGEL